VTPIVQAPTHATRPDRAGAVHRRAAVPHMPAGSVFRRQAQLSGIHGGGLVYHAFARGCPNRVSGSNSTWNRPSFNSAVVRPILSRGTAGSVARADGAKAGQPIPHLITPCHRNHCPNLAGMVPLIPVGSRYPRRRDLLTGVEAERGCVRCLAGPGVDGFHRPELKERI